MFEEIKNIKSETSDLRKFGITIGIVSIVIAGFFYWKNKESFQLLLTVGTVLCILGAVIPFVLKPVHWIWMSFATILNWFMTRVILSLLFYMIVTPIGLISRMLGKQFLKLKWNKAKPTYWNYHSGGVCEKENYEKQF
ncbi:MAG: hypothetical protein HQ510_02965 [Candidatus Marinimicrobia bacterium]|nr:hypothetical protein [Candidatus Neomarinimicrobiota bacterium]